jgi:glycosyltransferase involved in cell wall biosynthesis
MQLGFEQQEGRRLALLPPGGADPGAQDSGAAPDVPVEFAGWLPIFETAGNCGRHPQFTHTASPPAGYCFTRSGPPPGGYRSFLTRVIGRLGLYWRRGPGRVGRACHGLWVLLRPLVVASHGGHEVSLRARLRVLLAVIRLFVRLLRAGCELRHVLLFLRSRDFKSQLLLGDYRGLVFLPSVPFTFGQNPWVVEIEDPTTLFFPYVHNGHTGDFPITTSPYYRIVKALLESEQCKGILSHMKSTAKMVPTLFGSETIAKKVCYTPLGVRLPRRWQRHEEDHPEHLDLVLINSWCQIPGNFRMRGGLDVLDAFAILKERYPHLRLTLRSQMPELSYQHHLVIEEGWVRVISRFLSDEGMEDLLAGSHIFLLPAARVHIVSLLQAMSAGLAVVTSDGWGFDEYVTHGRNGLVVKGRYGLTSWADEEVGMLREEYESMLTPQPHMVQGIVEAVSRLVEDPSLRRRLGRQAREDVATTYNLERWNAGLEAAFDRIR